MACMLSGWPAACTCAAAQASAASIATAAAMLGVLQFAAHQPEALTWRTVDSLSSLLRFLVSCQGTTLP